MIIDCFPYFNEKELLELRINLLNDHVDQFVIIDGNYTHSGIPKEYTCKKTIKELGIPDQKIRVLEVDLSIESMGEPTEFDLLTDSIVSRERYQRDAISSIIDEYDNDAIFIVSDCDEIINPYNIWFLSDIVKGHKNQLIKIPLTYLQGRADYQVYSKTTGLPQHWGTSMFMCTKSHLNGISATQLRSDYKVPFMTAQPTIDYETMYDLGWHFSWMGSNQIRKIKSKSICDTNRLYDDLTYSMYGSDEMENFINEYEFFDGNESPSGHKDYIVKKYPIEKLPEIIFNLPRVKEYLLPSEDIEENIETKEIYMDETNSINILFSATNRDEIWETDYIIDKILPKNKTKFSYFIPCENIDQVDNNYDVFVYNCRKHNYQQILKIVQRIKPKIIIHLSDEYHYENLSEYNNLSKHCNLFLRQHHHPGFTYDDNVIQIPLGYCNDAGINEEDILKIDKRFINWSFIGDMKHDRWEMIENFKKIENHFTGCFIDKPQMMKIYLNSIFVPNGRGNSSLNCFRLYEASMAGAIPVVVGTDEEINCTFEYEECPPWLFFNSWEEASNECLELLKEKNILQKIQNDVISWWNSRIKSVSEKVENALTKRYVNDKKLEGLKVIQIGSNRGYDELSNHIKENYSSIDIGIFVEANPAHIDSLRECYSNYDNVYIENLAITYPKRNSNLQEIELFYHVDDGPNYEIASTKKEHIMWHDHLPGYDEKYEGKIQSFKVPCVILEQLFWKYNVQELDWLLLDVEGIDAEVILTTNWERYNIYRIDFEHIHLSHYKNAIEKMFIGMGYEKITALNSSDDWAFENKKLKEKRSVESCKKKLENFPKINYISVTDDSKRRDLLVKKFEKYGISEDHLIPHIFDRYKDNEHKIVSKWLDEVGWWKLSLGSRGPVTSHLKAIKKWYTTTDEPYAFFCEDDLGLDTVKYWNFTWEEFFNSLPSDWGCVQLVQLREIYSFSMGFRNRCWCDWSACAYLISREHAKQLIENYYYDDEFFDLDIKGFDIDVRGDWAKIPVVETTIFSSLSKVYTCPLFVEDVINCSSSYGGLLGITEGQCDKYHEISYDVTLNWWQTEAQYLTADQLKTI